MPAKAPHLLSLLSLAVGVGLYGAGVLGLLWEKTPPGDVGLLATSAVFALFGVVGLLLGRRPAAPPA